MSNGFERQTENEQWIWTPKLRNNDGSERQNWGDMVALNAKLKMRRCDEGGKYALV